MPSQSPGRSDVPEARSADAAAASRQGCQQSDRILQSYVWQDYDLAPDFPVLEKFLAFWRETLDGPLHSIQVAHRRLIGPNEWRKVDADFRLN